MSPLRCTRTVKRDAVEPKVSEQANTRGATEWHEAAVSASDGARPRVGNEPGMSAGGVRGATRARSTLAAETAAVPRASTPCAGLPEAARAVPAARGASVAGPDPQAARAMAPAIAAPQHTPDTTRMQRVSVGAVQSATRPARARAAAPVAVAPSQWPARSPR